MTCKTLPWLPWSVIIVMAEVGSFHMSLEKDGAVVNNSRPTYSYALSIP